MSKKKVFCEKCRYYSCRDYFGWGEAECCKKEISIKIESNYRKEEHYVKENLVPSYHNRKNDCQYYTEKSHWWCKNDNL